MTHERDDRWGPLLAGSLGLVALGLLAARPVLLAGAVVPLALVLYGRRSRLPDSPAVRAERAVEPSAPTPGQRVRVTLTVENVGDTLLPDVRVADGVPAALAVVDGTPRGAATLSPGESLTCRYTVLARRGEHEFAAPAVRVRSLAGSDVVTGTPDCEGATTLAALAPVSPPGGATAGLSGHGGQAGDRTGSGQEFYATRAYRPGDAVGRIDWRHFAKTGEFVTQQYRDERAGPTVLIVDVREPTRRARRPGAPTGGALAVYAGQRVLGALDGARVDLAVVGLDGDADLDVVGPHGLACLDADGRGNRARACSLLEAAETAAGGQSPNGADEKWATESAPPSRAEGGQPAPSVAGDGGQRAAGEPTAGQDPSATDRPGDDVTSRLLDHVPADASVVVVSPLLDDWPVSLARSLADRSAVVVLSPCVTDGGSPGARLARLDRQRRFGTLGSAGIETVDWDPADGLDEALGRTLQGGSAP